MKYINKRKNLEISKEFDFFVHNPLTKYKGLYVALIGNKVIASGDSAKEVWEKALKKSSSNLPTIAKLPKEEVLILYFQKIEKQFLKNNLFYCRV